MIWGNLDNVQDSISTRYLRMCLKKKVNFTLSKSNKAVIFDVACWSINLGHAIKENHCIRENNRLVRSKKIVFEGIRIYLWSTTPTTLRPLVINHYCHVRPSVSKLPNQATITASRACGLAEWIIDDSYLVFAMWFSFRYGLQNERHVTRGRQ